ncbi:lipopolysaccharide biosynthesis protein [Phaeacidiphilus oryzae]|uniref:lipopolysaccharide biosynthesis protein n=1 Tax=Phaeacidiphilus oryzae TaxID=348818 RepID=UPI00056B9605|nr:lipopolysaccharide biosynthesis protein [Phaeacidiphilus oryzae]
MVRGLRTGRAHGRHARPPEQVYRNSFLLLASSGTTAALGFLFWVVVARYYSPSQVGLATSLISAVSWISYLSLLGLNTTLIRFPAPGEARNGQITRSLLVVGGLAAVAGTVYLAGLPLYAPRLLFVRHHPWGLALFVLACVCAGGNLLTDSVFTGARVPQYNVLVDGLVQGLAKLALPIALTGMGALGIVGASGGGYAVAAAASLLLMHRRLGYRPRVRGRGTRLREQLGFSAANYVSSLLDLIPLLALPLIVLQRLGSAEAGYYFVAFQIAALVNSVSHAVGDALFAEVSYDGARFGALLRRSAAITAGAQFAAAAVVAAASGLLLRLFGGGYQEHARTLLVVLAAGSLAVALNYWASVVLRLAGLMTALMLSQALYAVVAVGLAYAWAPRGLVWLGWAWGAGNLACGLTALAALAVWRYRRREVRG